MKPVRLGNIYKTSLSDMVNVPMIVDQRRASIGGKLACYHDCNLVRYEKHPFEPSSTESNYQDVKYLHLNFGERCNIACIMCKVHIRERENKAILDPDTLIRNVDVRPFKEIVIQGGEPLYISECMEYMKYLGRIDKKYVLLTNGLLIDGSMALQLAKDADRVSVSLNAASRKTHELVNRGSNFDRIMRNIRRLIHSRESLGSNLRVHGRMTLTTVALHEIPLFLKTFRDLGFDAINFGYDRATVPAYLEQNKVFTEKLKEEIRSSAEEIEWSRVDTMRLEQLGLVRAGETFRGT